MEEDQQQSIAIGLRGGRNVPEDVGADVDPLPCGKYSSIPHYHMNVRRVPNVTVPWSKQDKKDLLDLWYEMKKRIYDIPSDGEDSDQSATSSNKSIELASAKEGPSTHVNQDDNMMELGSDVPNHWMEADLNYFSDLWFRRKLYDLPTYRSNHNNDAMSSGEPIKLEPVERKEESLTNVNQNIILAQSESPQPEELDLVEGNTDKEDCPSSNDNMESQRDLLGLWNEVI